MRYTEPTDTMVTGSRGIFAGSEYGLDPGFIADSFKARSAQAQATSCVVRTHQGVAVTVFGIIQAPCRPRHAVAPMEDSSNLLSTAYFSF